MKKFLILLLLCVSLTSCYDVESAFPRYSLTTIEFVPDSLKSQQRTWVTETIKAASQHMTGGDYEDVDDTIEQAELTSRDLFSIKIVGLKKEINDNYWDDIEILPKDFTESQRNKFKTLSDGKIVFIK